MSVTQHIQIQTRTGWARIALNQGTLLINFYSHHLLIHHAIIPLEDEAYFYQDGWNLDNLKTIVHTHEPRETPFHSK